MPSMGAAWDYIERTVVAAYELGNLTELVLVVGAIPACILLLIFYR